MVQLERMVRSLARSLTMAGASSPGGAASVGRSCGHVDAAVARVDCRRGPDPTTGAAVRHHVGGVLDGPGRCVHLHQSSLGTSGQSPKDATGFVDAPVEEDGRAPQVVGGWCPEIRLPDDRTRERVQRVEVVDASGHVNHRRAAQIGQSWPCRSLLQPEEGRRCRCSPQVVAVQTSVPVRVVRVLDAVPVSPVHHVVGHDRLGVGAGAARRVSSAGLSVATLPA